MTQRTLRGLLDGAVGGTVGTAAMSALMLLAGKAGLMGSQPPEIITAAALNATGVRRREETQDVLASLAHLGFGAVSGALFGVIHRSIRTGIHPALTGTVYGSLIWLVSYKGWVPALHIMPPPEKDRPGRPATMLAAHWVYGSILGLIVAIRDRD